MDLESLLLHYFGTADLEALEASALARGRDRLALDFGVERDPGRRFALWTLLGASGDAPSPDEAFEDPTLRQAAQAYLDAAWDLQRD